MLPLHFSKASPNVWRCLWQIHIFRLSSWARWNRPVLAKISSFSLRTSLDRWQLIRWCFTSSLHSDSRTKPLKPRDEPQFFPSLLFKKQSLDIVNVSLMNNFFLYLQLFLTRYKFGRSKGTHYNFVYSIQFQFPHPREAYCTSWVVSGYAREVKNGFVTFSLNWKDSRHSYEMVEWNTDCE